MYQTPFSCLMFTIYFAQELLTIVTSNLMPCFSRFLPRTVGANFESFFEQIMDETMTVMASVKGKVNEM